MKLNGESEQTERASVKWIYEGEKAETKQKARSRKKWIQINIIKSNNYDDDEEKNTFKHRKISDKHNRIGMK